MVYLLSMMIPIVNDQDEVIGEEERSIVHEKGIKHREIHVWLVTSNKEFIFQKRGLQQDTWPGFLDVTVGGHLDTASETYQEAAERELFEETGVKATVQFIMKGYSERYDPNTKSQNNAFRTTFAVKFEGSIEDLKVEDIAGLGFVKFSINDLHNMKEEEKEKFIPRFLEESYFDVYEKIINTLF